MIVKSRQVGMSQTVALEALHRAVYQDAATILLVSKNLEAAVNLLRYVKAMLPLIEPALKVWKDNETEILFSNRSRIKSVSASKSTGRSFAVTHAYLDEFAFMQWGKEIYLSVSPTISTGGTITILSTPYGVQNIFYKLWTGEFGADTVWSRHDIPWHDCPVFDGEWYKRERPKYTEANWSQEFEASSGFLSSGNPPFRAQYVKAAKDGWLGLQDGPIPGHIYLTAWDIGRRRDYTVGVTLDMTDDVRQIVAFERFTNAPFPYIYQKIDEVASKWQCATVIESNGIGDPVLESIDTLATPFVTSARSKANIIMALIHALENGKLKFGSDGRPQNEANSLWHLYDELISYTFEDKDIQQDTVMAAAMAVYHADRHIPAELLLF